MTILKEMNELDWVDVCALDDRNAKYRCRCTY